MLTYFVAEQECHTCGKRFHVEYCSNGTYQYMENTKLYREPCECASDFSPVENTPSFDEWLEEYGQD